MKVIFLDVDGVLNSDEYFDSIQGKDIQGIEQDVDIQKIVLLQKAVEETGARVVLTSSWRYKKAGEELRELLTRYGILTDVTPLLQNERGLEIKQWLVENEEVVDYVIVDDEVFASFDEELLQRLIRISNENGRSYGDGLQEKDVQEIIRRLGRRKQLEEEDFER